MSIEEIYINQHRFFLDNECGIAISTEYFKPEPNIINSYKTSNGYKLVQNISQDFIDFVQNDNSQLEP